MASYGRIMQYKGPFTAGATIELEASSKIGISINEKDFMSWPNFQFWFVEDIDGLIYNIIRMGRTQMYEIDNPISINRIYFPNGAPESTIVQIVYCEQE